MLKALPAQFASMVHTRRGQRNLRVLAKLLTALVVMIAVYSVAFHYLMEREGQDHSWVTGIYWTLTVMSTLGFGDVTFHSDLGRMFSLWVLMSGMIFLLVLLPFTFIEFLYEPWMQAREETRAPRKLPPRTRGHVLLTNHDAVTTALIPRLEQYGAPYFIVVPDVETALGLHDAGVSVMVGDLDDPATWTSACVETAALVASTTSDVTNTNVAFTVRALHPNIPIITSATDAASLDILELAGSTSVLRLHEMIGQAFARRTLGGDAQAHVVGSLHDVLVAEAMVHGTPLVGQTLHACQLRKRFGVTVVGVWERGRFEHATPETIITENTVLVLAASRDPLARYNEAFGEYRAPPAPVVIIGGGRVGRATARALARRRVDYRIIEPLAERVRDPEKYILGSAADLAVLERAGIREATTVIITPHDDDLNVYLTIYCRRLRPDVRILARATHERNIATLQRAGADSVLSYASMGMGAIMDMFERGTWFQIAEGLHLFRRPVPNDLEGKTIAESGIREETGCSIVALRTAGGMQADPLPSVVLGRDVDLMLIGNAEAEKRFVERFGRVGNVQAS